ncbi:hypothetical protein MAELSTROM_19 [Pseudoalteromonas phage Maelstrom]|uniref:hypothetical protein n=1 Tax=Pseudoalteromonas phage Maelstrom TaxID=2065202 RepID=UPI000CA368E7|nr:hypothetical protein PP584_gp19 [Pseudoalteromonas phage Maelstrom]AUG84939.1 hypothetical protein MAELSTROM_19 [Pseudoalteromonas phage Maelstrom]
MKTTKQLRAENDLLRRQLIRAKSRRETWRFNFFLLLAFLILLVVAQTYGIGVFR